MVHVCRRAGEAKENAMSKREKAREWWRKHGRKVKARAEPDHTKRVHRLRLRARANLDAAMARNALDTGTGASAE